MARWKKWKSQKKFTVTAGGRNTAIKWKKEKKRSAPLKFGSMHRKKEDSDKDGEDAEGSERVFKKKAFFFRFSQVEPIRRAEDECEKVWCQSKGKPDTVSCSGRKDKDYRWRYAPVFKTDSRCDRDGIPCGPIAGRAYVFAVVHNHPSGDPSPSDADIKITEQIAMAAKVCGVDMCDHIIIAGARKNTYFSFRENTGILQ